jgi:hypothetical protein
MTLSVASRRIDRAHDLSEHARHVLGFVDGGSHWLHWAVRDPHARYHFEDENALVAGVQAGLHDSGLVLLPRLGLLVSPVKLMTLDLADLRTLAKAEEGHAQSARKVVGILSGHDLVPASELAGLPGLLKEMEVNEAPLFQCMTLGEQLAILELRDVDDESELHGEAAVFARHQSRTALEFVDYYRAYLGLETARPLKSRERRQERAEEALATLLPILFHALDCPRVDALAPPWEVSAATEEWLLMGRRLGFSRLSRGVQQVIANADFSGEEDEEAERIVGAYLAGAQALLMSAEFDAGRMSQDGTCIFRAASQTHEAVVAAPPSGIITLSSFCRLRETPNAPSTSKRRKHDGEA